MDLSPRLSLLGHPVSQSLSPRLQGAALADLGLSWDYGVLDVAPEALDATLEHLEADPTFLGGNVTVPHKLAVFAWLAGRGRILHPEALQARAVNTLFRGPDGRFQGDSTDFRGALQALARETAGGDLETFLARLPGLDLAVLGTGGSAASLARGFAGLAAGPRSTTIFGRDLAKAAALASSLPGAEALPLAEFPAWIPGRPALVVQTTTVGMETGASVGASPIPAVLEPGQIAFDLVYKPHETPFLRQAAAEGATTAHGIWMLVGQGALALRRWVEASAPAEIAAGYDLARAMERMASTLA